VANPMLGIKDLFGSYWIALFITSVCANLIGLNISSAFNSAITIYIVIPLLMIPMMVLSGAMFPFDKLNRDVGNIDKVPGVAELMPTRWTYEALMVRQATGNEYDKRVYELKKEISVADFNAIYRIPKLMDALDECMKEKRNTLSGDAPMPFGLLHNEIQWFDENNIAVPFSGKDSLTAGLFTPATGERLRLYLEKVSHDFVMRSNKADKILDQFVSDNKKALSPLYDNYHNEKLEEIVRKVYEKNKILVYKDRLIQNIDPIFQMPSPTNIFEFRCHFMSPVKKFLGLTVDTFVFNNLLVLFSIIVLYMLLYYELLLHLITAMEKVRILKR